jgi:hypothetical protein
MLPGANEDASLAVDDVFSEHPSFGVSQHARRCKIKPGRYDSTRSLCSCWTADGVLFSFGNRLSTR